MYGVSVEAIVGAIVIGIFMKCVSVLVVSRVFSLSISRIALYCVVFAMLRRRSILFCEYLSLNGVIFIISLVFLKFFSIVD